MVVVITPLAIDFPY
jgi:hypothetical protein